MPDCASCSLFQLESENEDCLHINRPGGLELTRLVLELSGLQPGASIVDAACGTGGSLNLLGDQMGFSLTGLDLSLNMLTLGSRHTPNLPLIEASNDHIPLRTESQDAILVECALSLSGDSTAILSEFWRVLRPGGWLLVTDLYIREVLDPRSLDCLSAAACLSGVKTRPAILHLLAENNFILQTWQDQTPHLKNWLTRMVFKLGSLDAFYRQLTPDEKSAQSLSHGLGNGIKLGYYMMTAQKPAVQ
jgi:arsenite methyltransferase